MFKLNYCNKENENLSNVVLSQGTFRKQHFAQRSNNKTSSVTKINSKLENKLYKGTRLFNKQEQSYLNLKKPLFLSGSKQVTEDNTLLYQSSLSSSFYQDENKVKLRNNKLKSYKRKPLVEADTDCHRDILEAKSNFTPQRAESQTSQAPLKIPKHFKLNTSDLKLKSPVVNKSLARKLKKNGRLSNGNSRHSPYSGKFNDNSFAFLEGKLSTLRSLKCNTASRADREAFDVFSFPIKHCFDKHSISDMGSVKNSASSYEENSSNKHSFKIKPSAKDMDRKSNTEERSSNVDKSNVIESKFMTPYSFQTDKSNENTEVKIDCMEETLFASPVLGDMNLAVGLDSNVSSCVLYSKMDKIPTIQTDEVDQSRERSLSPILNESEGSCEERIHHLRMKTLRGNMTNVKSNVCVVENEGENCQSYCFSSQIVGSPVLDSSQQKKNIFIKKWQTASCKSYMNPKLDIKEFSPSPVLDASQFKEPFVKLKNLPEGEICLNPDVKEVIYISPLRQKNGSSKVNCRSNHKETPTQEHCFEINKGFEEESCLKEIERKESVNYDVPPNLSGTISNEGFFIDRSRLDPLEDISEPLSQILGSNGAKYVWSEANNATQSTLKMIQNPMCLAIASEATLFHNKSTSKFKNAVIDLIAIDKEKYNRHQAERFPVFSSHDEQKDSCSPVLDTSQYMKILLHKQTETQTPKCQENWSKAYIGSQSFGIKNHLDRNKSESVKLHCNKMFINAPPPTKPLCSSISLSDLENLIPGYVTRCNQSKTSTTISDKCLTASRLLEPMKSADYNLPHSISKHPKRKHSPITDSKLRLKKQKNKVFGDEMERLGPMLGLVSKSPVSDNGLCPNVSNLDQDETLICSPSFNSELDIRKFPIMLPDLPDQCSPKERSERLQTDNNFDTVISSQIYLDGFERGYQKEGLFFKEACQDKIEPNLSDKSKLLLASSSLIAESTLNSISHNTELISPILSRSEACKNLNFSPRTDRNDIGNSPILNKGETHIGTQNQFTENNSNSREYSVSQETGKRHVKKNLSLYYKEVKSVTRSVNDKFSKHSCSENRKRTQPKDKETLEDEGMACESQISGVGKLQTLPCEYADSEKLRITCEHQNSKGQMPLMLENNSPSHKRVKPLEPPSSSKSDLDKDTCKNVATESKQQSRWKSQIHLFDDNEEICIEDFDEESPVDKESAEITVPTSDLDSVTRNLNHNLEQSPSCTVITKKIVPEVKSLLLNFELNNQSENTCEYMSSEDSSCEVEIQEDFSQRTSETSPNFRIENSTTPTTKSSEGTQNEAGSNPPSFPPALDVEANMSPSAGVLDSACKNRRTRVKKGSAVERLRRLVRGQRAEVNMFHHEASAPARARARTCSLCVTSATQACSLLVLNCRYMDAQRMTSQEFGSGEEVVDPEVHVYIDPSYAKNITAGCTVTVFPPWHSVWQESRGVVVMYCVTKLQLGTHSRSLPGVARSLTCRSDAACTTPVEFSCQFQDEHCCCRNQLVGQLFTAPQQEAVQSAGGTDGAITAALAGGWFPHRVKLILTVLHSFQTRSRHNEVQTRILCVDADGHICQLNLRSEPDTSKLGPLKEALYKTFVMKKLTVCRRICIDRCKGLRSFLTHLHADSANQQIMYVATPSSDEWTAQLIEETADSHTSADIHSRIICCQQQLLSLPINEEVEGRARARVRVMAVRGAELFAWDPQLDSYFKLNITASAAIPNFPARACLDLLYLWAHRGELTIDKFTEVYVVEEEGGDSPTIPPLSVDSSEGNLVLLDSIVTKVSSEAYLRWEGSCGHKVLRVQKTGLYFCVTCRQTSASSTQKVVLEVCVAVLDIPHPIRVKVKSETARVLLGDTSGQISSDKSYNMIGVIGSTLKCLAVVTEVLRNSFGDIIEFILDEL